MKISEVTVKDLQEYLRVDEEIGLSSMLLGAKEYIKGYTGLSEEQLDEHEDLTIALYVLVGDMYDNRQYSVNNYNVNQLVLNTLSMHSINLL